MTTQKKTHFEDFNFNIDGKLEVTEETILSGGATITGGLTTAGTVTMGTFVAGTLSATNGISVGAGGATITGATTLYGGATISSGLTVSSGTVTLVSTSAISAIKMTQTLGGTNVSGDQTWTGGNAPTLTVGMYYFTMTSGASTFRIPCWPTT